MVPYYKICNITERIRGCLPHGWNWSVKVPVYFKFTLRTKTQPRGDAIAFFGDDANEGQQV